MTTDNIILLMLISRFQAMIIFSSTAVIFWSWFIRFSRSVIFLFVCVRSCLITYLFLILLYFFLMVFFISSIFLFRLSLIVLIVLFRSLLTSSNCLFVRFSSSFKSVLVPRRYWAPKRLAAAPIRVIVPWDTSRDCDLHYFFVLTPAIFMQRLLRLVIQSEHCLSTTGYEK